MLTSIPANPGRNAPGGHAAAAPPSLGEWRSQFLGSVDYPSEYSSTSTGNPVRGVQGGGEEASRGKASVEFADAFSRAPPVLRQAGAHREEPKRRSIEEPASNSKRNSLEAPRGRSKPNSLDLSPCRTLRGSMDAPAKRGVQAAAARPQSKGLVSTVAESIGSRVSKTFGRAAPGAKPYKQQFWAKGEAPAEGHGKEEELATRAASDSRPHRPTPLQERGKRQTIQNGVWRHNTPAARMPELSSAARRCQSTEPFAAPGPNPAEAALRAPGRSSMDVPRLPFAQSSSPGILMSDGNCTIGSGQGRAPSRASADSRVPLDAAMARLAPIPTTSSSRRCFKPSLDTGNFRDSLDESAMARGQSDPRQMAAAFEETIERLFDLTPRGSAHTARMARRRREAEAAEAESDSDESTSDDPVRPFKKEPNWPKPEKVLQMAVCQRMMGRAALGLGQRLDRRVMAPPGHMENLMREVLFERKLEAVFVSFALFAKWDPDAMVTAQKSKGIPANRFMVMCNAARLSSPETFGAFREIFVRYSHREMMVFKKFLTALPDIAQLCHKSVMQVIETFMAINAEKRICIHVD
eukprot:jgi/Tetstr1/435616/TSEL_024518.t1